MAYINKKLVLIGAISAILSAVTLSESQAECTNNQTCGNDCCWKIDGDTLTITGSGKMSDYSINDNRAPWRSAENFKQVKNVVIDGITSVGSCAFYNTGITKLTMSDTVTDIGANAFAWSGGLTDIKLSDNLKNLGDSAFRGSRLSEITLPADVSIGLDALGSKQPTIICKGSTDECAILYNQLENYKYIEYQEPFSSVSLPLGDKVQTIGELNCESTNYYWSGTDCKNKKNGVKCAENYSLDDDNNCIICNKQGYKNVGGYCNRIRYTPAEAAEVLHNDNTNEVTITFKK